MAPKNLPVLIIASNAAAVSSLVDQIKRLDGQVNVIPQFDANLFKDQIWPLIIVANPNEIKNLAAICPQVHQIPGVFVAAVVPPEDIAAAVDAGVDDFFTGPLDDDCNLSRLQLIMSKIARHDRPSQQFPHYSTACEQQLNMCHKILAVTPDCFILLDRDTRLEYINKTLLGLLNLEWESIQHKSMLDIPAFARLAPEFQQKFQEVISVNKSVMFNAPLVLSGAERQVEFILSPARDDQGLVVVGTIRDVTERIRVEERLHQLAQVVEQSPSIVQITNLKAELTYVNPKFSEVTGYSYEEVIGQNPNMFRSNIETADFYKDLWKLLLSGQEWRGEFCNKRRNGELYWESATIAPFVNISGQTTHYIKVAEDITEKKKSLEALKLSEANFRAMLNNSLQSFLLLDKDKNIIAYNNIANQRTRLISERALKVGESFINYVSVANRANFSRAFQQTLHGKTMIEEWCLTAPNGQNYWMELNFVPVYTQDRQITGICLAALDITERKNIEEELRQLNASKDKFFSILSHDMKTPFASLIGYTDLVINHFDMFTEAELKNAMQAVRDSSESLHKLVENILTWSQVQRGSMNYEPQMVNIRMLVVQNETLFSQMIREKQIDFAYDIDDALFVFADQNMLDTILRNLIANALKFTPARGTVRIQAREEGDFMHIRVQDTGIGIPAEHLPKIFAIDRNYKATGTAGERGTGLGLTLCRELVELNHGQIWVESQIGQGTTFTFTAPLEPIHPTHQK